MKTQGFDIERLRIEDDMPRCNLLMAALVVAVPVQQLIDTQAQKEATSDDDPKYWNFLPRRKGQ